MTSEFLEVWTRFIEFRNHHIGSLNFNDSRSKFILVLYARINALCEETLTLVYHNCYVSPQILMRSTLESYIDLRCLLNDEEYINCIYAAEADSEHKHQSHHSPHNPYYGNSKPLSPERLESLKLEKSGGLNIYERFQKAECVDLYRTIYNHLCRHTHGNISALASKNFENDKIVFKRKISDTDLLFILSSTINVALSSTLDVFGFFNISEIEKEQCTKMHEEISALCKKYV